MAANITQRRSGQLTIAQAAKLLATLSAEERRILEEIALGSTVAGSPGVYDHVLIQRKPVRISVRKWEKPKHELVAGLMRAAKGLVKNGWVRFVTMGVDETFGYFYATEEGERVWNLRR